MDTMGFYSASENGKIEQFSGKWTEPEIITLSKKKKKTELQRTDVICFSLYVELKHFYVSLIINVLFSSLIKSMAKTCYKEIILAYIRTSANYMAPQPIKSQFSTISRIKKNASHIFLMSPKAKDPHKMSIILKG